jgi:hypothetical protein
LSIPRLISRQVTSAAPASSTSVSQRDVRQVNGQPGSKKN